MNSQPIQTYGETMKAALRGKYTALSIYTHTHKWKALILTTAQLKALEQKEEITLKSSRLEEIIKLRVEVNKVETKRTVQRINETKR